MGRTLVACAAFLVLAIGAARWLTLDFNIWTAEGARRFEVASAPVAAPDVTLDGPGLRDTRLPEVLAANQAVTIVDFIYTSCQTVCQVLGTGFQQLQARIEADAWLKQRVRLLSISFDPARDTTDVLRDHADHLGADPAIWTFARIADQRQLATLLDRFNVVVIPDGQGGYAHNAALLVVDRDARLVRIFDYSELDTALAYAVRLADRQVS
ncbi:MAG: SCO family protein [Gammaproteobacteria bacterium PRO9]|nr:SCO family protein [Gammaproteobacteria bacterium PRO9]